MERGHRVERFKRGQTGETNDTRDGKGGKRGEKDGYGKMDRKRRQMRMRLTKGLERGDRLEEGQRMIKGWDKDEKGSESRKKDKFFFISPIRLYDLR